MASAATASKYRHAVGKQVRFEECYSDLSIAPSNSDASNSLAISNRWIAYKHGGIAGNSIGILDIGKPGKIGKQSPVIHAHAGSVLDLAFSPFGSDGNLLASSGEDGSVRLWRLPAAGLPEGGLTESWCNLAPLTSRRVDQLQFHPTASGLLTAASHSDLGVWDIDRAASGPVIVINAAVVNGPSTAAAAASIQGFSWKESGQTLATTSKDGILRLWDPRAKPSPQPQQSGQAHSANSKSCRVIWLGDGPHLLTTGFSQMRQQEFAVFDCRSDLSKPLLRTQLDSASNVLMPVYDSDTGLMYLVSRGSNTIRWLEWKDGQIISNGTPTALSQPVGGAALLPKSLLSVMEAEVNRLLVINGDSICPVSYKVPRKSYRDFHEDLFPPTRGNIAALAGQDWICGGNGQVKRKSLDPNANRPTIDEPADAKDAKLSIPVTIIQVPQVVSRKKALSSPASPGDEKTLSSQQQQRQLLTVDGINRRPSAPATAGVANIQPGSSRRTSSAASSVMTGLRQSAYRYISGHPMHPKNNFEDLRQLHHGLSGESNILESNSKFIAYPLSGAGGRVAVLRADQPHRLPAVVPSCISGSELCDFSLSRIHPNLLATATEDSRLRIWKLPDEPLTADLTEPAAVLSGHLSRVNHCQWHPYVSNVLLSTSPEQFSIEGGQVPTVRVWDVSAGMCKEMRQLIGFTDQILGCAWSANGSGLLAVACKDKNLRLFDPRSRQLVNSTQVHDGVRACRMVWIEDKLVSVGFGKGSIGEVVLLDPRQLSGIESAQCSTAVLQTLTLDHSPSIICPQFDEDSRIVYLCGKGDTGILPVEIDLHTSGQQPLYPLPRFSSPGGSVQQGVSFQSRRVLDVRSVEIARCWRLTLNNIEQVSFSVPRNRKEFFQDDLFPATRDLGYSASMSSNDWFNSGNKDSIPQPTIDLRPPDMIPLSQAPVEVKREKKYSLSSGEPRLTDSQKRQQFLDKLFTMAKDDGNVALPQDSMEGTEWDD